MENDQPIQPPVQPGQADNAEPKRQPWLEVFVDLPNIEIELRSLNWPDRIDYARLSRELAAQLPGGPFFLKKVWCFGAVRDFDATTGVGVLSRDRNVSHLRAIKDSTSGIADLVLSHRLGRVGEEREKGVDVNLATYMMERACDGKFHTAVLISNDSDYAGLVRRVRARGVTVVWAYVDRQFFDNDHLRHAVSSGYNMSRSLIRQCEWR